MSNRVFVRSICESCGAPIDGLECRYCGTRYEWVEQVRYVGPDIPDGERPSPNTFGSGGCSTKQQVLSQVYTGTSSFCEPGMWGRRL